jgi:hypothetical protein
MMFSTLHFVITTLLAITCAKAIGVSDGDISVLALAIPALWILPRKGASGLVLLAGMLCYGLTLPHQSISLSVTQWTLFPLLFVAFSKRSNRNVRIITASIVSALQAGIMVSQALDTLEGSPLITLIQMISICVIWWAARHKSISRKQNWWVLALILPLWFADQAHTIVVALSITGIIASLDSLSNLKGFRWNKLIYWTVPAVGFATLVVWSKVEVPHQVVVVWMCLLATAWMTDYILRSMELEARRS